MNHYFSVNNDSLNSNPKLIQFKIRDVEYTMETDHGVFSKAGLDYGSRVLLEAILPLEAHSILDLGCGYGPIGIVLKKETKAQVTMSDINPRAIKLAAKNAVRNHVNVETILSDGFQDISSSFDAIVCNPPIRAGKQVYYQWISDAGSYLNENGCLFLVARKQQGAPSLIKECEQYFSQVQVIERNSGYYVIKCQK